MLTAGIIGLGVGERHIEGYEGTGRCRVAVLCDFDEDKLQEVGARYPGKRLTTNAQDVLRDPGLDVVSIASYDEYHHGQILAAVETGKHVFVEKPVCLYAWELEEIVVALDRHPAVRMSSNLVLRGAPRFIELRNRISRGELGDIYYFEGDYDYGRIHKLTHGWRGKGPYYSVVLGGAIHLIDLMQWMTRERVARVSAFSNRISTSGTDFRHHDFVAALLQFDNEMIAKVTANFGSVTPHHHRLSVYGTAATFTQGHTGAAYLSSRDPGSTVELIDDPYPGVRKGDLLPSFVDSILDGGEPVVGKIEVIENMSIALAIEKALETGSIEEVYYY